MVQENLSEHITKITHIHWPRAAHNTLQSFLSEWGFELNPFQFTSHSHLLFSAPFIVFRIIFSAVTSTFCACHLTHSHIINGCEMEEQHRLPPKIRFRACFLLFIYLDVWAVIELRECAQMAIGWSEICAGQIILWCDYWQLARHYFHAAIARYNWPDKQTNSLFLDEKHIFVEFLCPTRLSFFSSFNGWSNFPVQLAAIVILVLCVALWVVYEAYIKLMMTK